MPASAFPLASRCFEHVLRSATEHATHDQVVYQPMDPRTPSVLSNAADHAPSRSGTSFLLVPGALTTRGCIVSVPGQTNRHL